MASIGGLDLGFGSQLQIVRTNVLCVNVASTGVTAAGARNLHSILNQGMPSLLAPDFTYFYQDSDTDGAGITQAGQESLFDQDPNNDGTVETTLFDNGGVLRNLKETPLVPGGANANRSDSGSAATLAASVAFGDTINDLLDATDADVMGGKMSLEGVLSASIIDLDSATASTEEDDLFTSTSTSTTTATGSPLVYTTTTTTTTDGLVNGVMGDALTQAYENFASTSTFSGSAVAGHNTGGGKVFTMNLLPLLGTSSITTAGGITPSATVVNGLTSSDTVGTALADIAGNASLISVLSLARAV
jgi:hypothetical protein